jgi:hypothetical protein
VERSSSTFKRTAKSKKLSRLRENKNFALPSLTH